MARTFILPVLYVEVPDKSVEEIHFPSCGCHPRSSLERIVEAGRADCRGRQRRDAVVCRRRWTNCIRAACDFDRELCAHGRGQHDVRRWSGALPMTGVIVRSSANVRPVPDNPAVGDSARVWIVLFVVGLASVLRMIPTASLAAMLVYTGYKLLDMKSIKKLLEYGWGEVAIYAVTVEHDRRRPTCLPACWWESRLAAVKLLYTFSHLDIAGGDRKRPDEVRFAAAKRGDVYGVAPTRDGKLGRAAACRAARRPGTA